MKTKTLSLREKLAEILGCNLDGTVTIDQDVCTDTETFHSYPKQYKHLHLTMPDDKLCKVLEVFNSFLIDYKKEYQKDIDESKTDDTVRNSQYWNGFSHAVDQLIELTKRQVKSKP